MQTNLVETSEQASCGTAYFKKGTSGIVSLQQMEYVSMLLCALGLVIEVIIAVE